MSEILLVDLSAIFWACWHSSVNDEVSAARNRTLAQIRRLANGRDYVAICCDEGTSFRKAIYPDYKANRPEKDKAALDELRQTKERLVADGVLLWGASGFEADDVIATATMIALDQEHVDSVTIATADKDLTQLVADRVTIASTRSGDALDREKVKEKFGVYPELMGQFLALVGDKSDNVPGVAKVGEKTAANLLNHYGSIEKIRDAVCSDVADLPYLTPAIRGSLLNSGASLDLSLKLVTLRTDAPIAFTEIFDRREQKKLETREYGMDERENALVDTGGMTEPEGTNVGGGPEKPPDAEPEPPSEEAVLSAVAVRLPFEQQLQPQNSGSAWKLAQILYQSRLYQKFANAESILAVILRGREMGLGALTALDSFHVIEGKPSPYAYLIIARAKAHPDCEYFQCVETTAESATWETKNRNNPSPTRLTYTYAQAVVAGLPKTGAKGPNGWLKTPDDMVRKTGGVKLARFEYPDAALGLYAAEELGYDEE